MEKWSNAFFNNLYFHFDQLRKENIYEIVSFINNFSNTDDRICDFCCGYGRIAFALSKRNYCNITGIDKSIDMIKLAKGINSNQGSNVKFICEDVRNIKNLLFDVVLFLGTSFGYYDDKDNQKIIKSINSILKPGGLFLFQQVNNPQNLFIKEEDSEYLFEKQSSFDKDKGVYKGDYSFHNKASQKRISYKFNIHLYSKDELVKMFTKKGFNSIEYWGGFNFESFSKVSKDLIIKSVKL